MNGLFIVGEANNFALALLAAGRVRGFRCVE